MTSTTFDLTDLEKEIAHRISGYSFFDQGIVEDSGIWASVLIDETGDPKVYRGVIASLVKKGFFNSSVDGRDTWLGLTKAGAEYAAEMDFRVERSEAPKPELTIKFDLLRYNDTQKDLASMHAELLRQAQRVSDYIAGFDRVDAEDPMTQASLIASVADDILRLTRQATAGVEQYGLAAAASAGRLARVGVTSTL